MFDCVKKSVKSQVISGQREKFVRLDSMDSRYSQGAEAGLNKCTLNLQGPSRANGAGQGNNNNASSGSFKKGFRRGSKGLWSLGRSIGLGVSRAVFPEDLKVSEKKIFDPQDKFLLLCNKLFVTSCILAVSVDPLFLYLPFINDSGKCIGIDRRLATIATTLRTFIDVFYLFRMALQFRTAFVAPSSRVFGRGELVIDPAQIAKRYLQQYFIVDFLSVLPLPQIVGALWYLLALERVNGCWKKACLVDGQNCTRNFLFCGNENMDGYAAWNTIKESVLQKSCPVNVTDGDNPPFDFGIYLRALSSGIVSSESFVAKYFFCLWWGLQNLSTLGQGLETSTYPGEIIFSIALAVAGLLLFALLIGNMQTYLQSLTIRLEEMRVKRRDSEQWMHHRMLPPDLRERVRRYDQYKWLETKGVDEENLVQNLPKDLRRDIKRHLCLALVRRVPLFENMEERLLDAICERLKPCLYTEKSYLVREGDPVNEMLFIIRGRLESVTTDGGRSGFFNRSLLKEGDFCGEELLTWALDPKSGSNLPSSTRTAKALTEVEAFALIADELKFVASQFRRLHSRQVQHTFRFYSQQWRTWAAIFIQAAWRRYVKKKKLEQLKKEEEEEEEEGEGPVASIRATFLASKFAANALRKVHQNRIAAKSTKELVIFQKPSEPDFSADDP
ncbi:hypothetical protein IGI04_013484 [Brassica rapa subsp. trilocularis]|uniref:Cyclic nucleotide-binding domain-containing protein n=1 Tax=Brassica rapa subsp. trilocularis TaxID=1813537 RepID=A0ABQ7NBD4_BRACM|nr:hypothetical protein IGI04_013484 [Brassica rapa subsp. trilocularis]